MGPVVVFTGAFKQWVARHKKGEGPMLSKSALIGAIILSVALSSKAQVPQTDQTTLETIIVEGSRLEQTATESGSSVSIITAEEIDRLGFDQALDAVAVMPGVTVNTNGAFGGAASIRIRGALSEQTLVLIDGVVVNDTSSPGGGYDFARLDTQNIARIEVLKGPQSTLWGTDAIGGVVSITTKSPEAGDRAAAFAEYGSYNSFRGGASVERANNSGDLRLAIVGTSSDGNSKADQDNGNLEEDAFETLSLSAKGGLNLGGDARLSANLLWTDADTEFDSFVFGKQGNVGDGDELSQTEELSAHVSLTGTLLEGRLENLLLIGYSDIKRENFTNGTPAFSAEGERTLFRYQGTLNINESHSLAFGAEREDTRASDEKTSIDGLFALYAFKPVQQVTLTGGLRMDDHERFGSETTARFAAAYNPGEHLTLRASWGQGFKAPTLFQTTFFCCGATEPNADLSAETSEAFDIGMDWKSATGRAQAGLTYFDQKTQNQIDFSFSAGGYENIAKVESQGVEIYGAYQLTDWMELAANYAFIDARNGNGVALSRLPEHSGDLTFSLNPDGPFSGAILLHYNGEERNTDGTRLDDWTRIDLSGRYKLDDQVELFGRFENLFDASYQQVLGYGMPGRSGSFGIRLRY